MAKKRPKREPDLVIEDTESKAAHHHPTFKKHSFWFDEQVVGVSGLYKRFHVDEDGYPFVMAIDDHNQSGEIVAHYLEVDISEIFIKAWSEHALLQAVGKDDN